MSEKRLTIAFKANLQDGQRALDLLQKLTKAGNANARKSLFNIDLTGGGKGGKNPWTEVSKSLAEDTKLLTKMGPLGEKLGRIFRQDVSRGMKETAAEAAKLNRELEVLAARYEELQGRKNQSSGRVTRGLNSVLKNIHAKTTQLRMLQDDEPGGRFGMASGLLGMMGLGGIGSMLQSNPGLAPLTMGLMAGRWGMNTWTSALNWGPQGAMLPFTTAANFGQTAGQLQLGRASIDYQQLFAERQIDRDPVKRKMLREAQDAAAKREMEPYFNPIYRTARALFHPLDTYEGIITGEYMDRERNAPAAAQAARGAIESAAVQAERAANPVIYAQLDDFTGKLASNVSIARRLGSMSDVNYLRSGKAVRDYGMTGEELINLQLGLVSSGGRSAKGLLGSAAASVRGGMDAGAAAALAGTGSVSGDLLRNLRGTGLDPVTQELLGRSTLSYMTAAHPLSGWSGLVNAIGAGSDLTKNSALQQRIIQQNIGGMGLGEALTAGFDPFQQTKNMANTFRTMKNLGVNDINVVNAVNSLPFATLLSAHRSGEVPPELASMNLDKNTLDKVYYDRMSLKGRVLVPDKNARTEQESKLGVYKYLDVLKDKYDMNPARYMESFGNDKAGAADAAKALGAYLFPSLAGTGAAITSPEGLLRVLGNQDVKGKSSTGDGAKNGDTGGAYDALILKAGKMGDMFTEIVTKGSKLNQMFQDLVDNYYGRTSNPSGLNPFVSEMFNKDIQGRPIAGPPPPASYKGPWGGQ